MTSYSIDLKIPSRDIEEFIEHLRTLGAVDTLQLTIEAKDRRTAVRETAALLEEFAATYRGTGLDVGTMESIQDGLRVGEPREGISF